MTAITLSQIAPLPQPPQSIDPQNFSTRADEFLAALPDFGQSLNAWGAALQAQSEQMLAALQLDFDAATQAAAAATQAASSAQLAAQQAAAAIAAPPWSAQVEYALGALAWSAEDGLIYRRLLAGRSALDPSVDAQHWLRLGGPEEPPAHQGVLQTVEATVEATAGAHYVLCNTTDAQQVLLPPAPAVGDTVRITVANGLQTNSVDGNGNPVMGLDEAMVLDVIGTILTLQWLPVHGQPNTWRIV